MQGALILGEESHMCAMQEEPMPVVLLHESCWPRESLAQGQVRRGQKEDRGRQVLHGCLKV